MAVVLVIGSGGREHALAWKLSQSSQVSRVLVCPGNPGTTCDKMSNVAIDIKNYEALCSWCKEQKVELVVVGPEDPLANGIADALTAKGIKCFGPSAAAAQIEASKSFAKEFMDRHGIPTARWQCFTDAEAATHFINNSDYDALVVKASGLAAGKGVTVAKDKKEAWQAARAMLTDGQFGSAGSSVVVEELLQGQEISCLAFSDGVNIACFPAAQDHKRVHDGDLGPNTGGMGAYCPCPLVTQSELEVIRTEVLQKAVDGLRNEGKPFVGVLYAGMMLTKHGPRTLEFNCRFGDPETQVLLPLLKSDLYEVMQACCDGRLDTLTVQFEQNTSAVAVVLASAGYPGHYSKGHSITGCQAGQTELPNAVLPSGDSGRLLVFHAGTAVQADRLVTAGGRVLSAVALCSSLLSAASLAQLAAHSLINFEGKLYRTDIAHKALKRKGLNYAAAGVDIEAGDRLVDAIKPLARATSRAGCTVDLSMFGGLFDLKQAGFQDPLLVSGTDGVGTKLKVAQEFGEHSTVGIDLVAMCVNDILAHGAEPLYFLDYFACSQLDVGMASEVIKGIAAGCMEAGCALIGGETAEMPGMYQPGDYDLAGFAVGAVERPQYLPRLQHITAGDLLIGLPSTGLHSNGFSLVRKVVQAAGLNYSDLCPFADSTLGQALLTPTQIYTHTVLPLMKQGLVKAFAHITGGGLPGNLPRILPPGLSAILDATCWKPQPVFGWLARMGDICPEEMASTFNCGIGAVIVADPSSANKILDTLADKACHIGKLVASSPGEERVKINNLDAALKACCPNGVDLPKKVKVGVLISGSGTNLQALIDHCQQACSAAQIAVVISNKPGVVGLERAQQALIPCKVIEHKRFADRETFDAALDEALKQSGVELVCLAGFMRILSGGFVRSWAGRMLNIHPSLLPAFKGHNAHEQVLASGVTISGCTVHFVAEEVDAGAILVQESVPVYPGDSLETLQERVKQKEHIAFPRALELVASGKASLGANNKVLWKS